MIRREEMKQSVFIIFSLLLFIAYSCKQESEELVEPQVIASPMERLSDDEAGRVIRKAIEYVGGWEAWEAKINFSFYKNITHLDSLGNIERSQRQHHRYQLYPGFKANMQWEDKGNQYEIIHNGEQAKKYENGKEMTDDNSKNQAWNSSYGSNYVISMPFKLTDPGVIMTYEGIDSTTLDRRVHSVKIEYKKGAGSTGGMHTWWYYFDENNYDLAANFLDYGKHSLTTYETFVQVDDIRIHKKRFSHIADSEKNIVQKRTVYENETMIFNQDLDEDLFILK